MSTPIPECAESSDNAHPIPRWHRVRAWVLRHPLLSAAVAALAVRVTFTVVSFLVNKYTLIPDEYQYIELARRVSVGRSADSWAPGYGQSLYGSTFAFTGVLRLLYAFLPATRLVGQLLAVAYGVGVVVLTVKLALYVVRPRWALLAGGLAALVPSQILWSSVALRESAVWFGAVVVSIGVAVLGRGRRQAIIGITIIAAGLAELGLLRQQTLVIAAWAAAGAALVNVRRVPLRSLAAGLIALIVPALFGLGIGGASLVHTAAPALGRTRTALAAGADSAFASTIPAPPTGPSTTTTASQPCGSHTNGDTAGAVAIAHRRACQDTRGDTIIPGAVAGTYLYVDDSTSANLRQIPRGLVAVTLRPFPWEHTKGIDTLFARVENLAWYALYVIAAAGLWIGRKQIAMLAYPALLIAGVLSVGAVTQGNLGTSFRHRGQILWALAVLTAVAAQTVADRVSDRRMTT